jgi:hypothetical protein
MPKYIVNSPLHHDGTPYAIGAKVEMKEEQAARLLELGVVALVEENQASDIDKMTVAELTAKLQELKVEIPAGAKKADLVKLYSEAPAGGAE